MQSPIYFDSSILQDFQNYMEFSIGEIINIILVGVGGEDFQDFEDFSIGRNILSRRVIVDH